MREMKTDRAKWRNKRPKSICGEKRPPIFIPGPAIFELEYHFHFVINVLNLAAKEKK